MISLAMLSRLCLWLLCENENDTSRIATSFWRNRIRMCTVQINTEKKTQLLGLVELRKKKKNWRESENENWRENLCHLSTKRWSACLFRLSCFCRQQRCVIPQRFMSSCFCCVHHHPFSAFSVPLVISLLLSLQDRERLWATSLLDSGRERRPTVDPRQKEMSSLHQRHHLMPTVIM